ncbi:tyrosine-protein phosphatase non-receptor type 11-like isoform X1 [Clytia hemisphaerica]|uniref:protein-tyrosine-phosphatase n=1 Tax=Clytia hemisphaerica TaxID=252671 RepID=A0A7M5V2L9_9CNID
MASTRRWFHQNIGGLEAEKLLLACGRDGSFLCRPSTNKVDYTLSVRKNGAVTHIKVLNRGDNFDLGFGGDPFPTLSSLVTYYMENELREKSGELIELLYPMNCKDPTTRRWFHGHISGTDSERLMLDKGKSGSFMVRESVTNPGNFVVTARTEDIIKHVMIRNIDGSFDFGGGTKFGTLTELVDHYRENPMVEKNGGTVLHLKHPMNSTKFTAASIKDRVTELQKESEICSGKDGFWEEFEQLQQQEYKHKYTKKVGLTSYNKHKNVFRNIVPFDHTRVVLTDGDPDDPKQDYINASYIDGEFSHEYIATQACLEETIVDFWRMVYSENTHVILMGMKLIEKGKKRCAQYWPDCDHSMKVGQFDIACNKETETQEFVLREFELRNNDEPEKGTRTVYHYQFIAWPEHGLPENVGSILGILHDINLKQKDYDYPIVVQCSNGIGRTATFIIIDMLLKIVQRKTLDCEIDVQKTVQHVRTQRANMVQLEGQYTFIYLALAHYIEMENFNPHVTSPPKPNVPTQPVAPAIPERPPPRNKNLTSNKNNIPHRPPPAIPSNNQHHPNNYQKTPNGGGPDIPPTPPPRNPSKPNGPPSLLGMRLVQDLPESPAPGTPPARPPPRGMKP